MFLPERLNRCAVNCVPPEPFGERPARPLCFRSDPRLGLGRLHLLPERRRPPGAQDVGSGDPAGPPSGPGPGLRRHGGRRVRQLLW